MLSHHVRNWLALLKYQDTRTTNLRTLNEHVKPEIKRCRLPSYYYCLSVRSYIKHDYDGDVETLITFWLQTRLNTMITSCPSALTLAAEAEKQEPNP